jgi:hypothetical protein
MLGNSLTGPLINFGEDAANFTGKGFAGIINDEWGLSDMDKSRMFKSMVRGLPVIHMIPFAKVTNQLTSMAIDDLFGSSYSRRQSELARKIGLE